MGNKKKLAQFAELRTFPNVVEVGYKEALDKDHPLKGHWHEKVFGNENPIVLELGCGKGEYSLGMARLYPGRNFIGMDIKGARMWRGAKTAIEEGLNNVYFLRSRIDFIASFFTPGEVEEIWLTFPDPQARSTRERKRLTNDRFMDRYLSILKKGGAVNLKTDSDFLYEYSLAKAEERGMNISRHSPDVYRDIEKLGFNELEKQVIQIRTFYEKMFTVQGHKISYLRIGNGH